MFVHGQLRSLKVSCSNPNTFHLAHAHIILAQVVGGRWFWRWSARPCAAALRCARSPLSFIKIPQISRHQGGPRQHSGHTPQRIRRGRAGTNRRALRRIFSPPTSAIRIRIPAKPTTGPPVNSLAGATEPTSGCSMSAHNPLSETATPDPTDSLRRSRFRLLRSGLRKA
jgi:hypothetical protein